MFQETDYQEKDNYILSFNNFFEINVSVASLK